MIEEEKPFTSDYRWDCPACGGAEFAYSETAEVISGGVLDENLEFTIDDTLEYKIEERSEHVVCVGCGETYRFAGTQGGEQDD